jgi:hypothetical protein
VLESAGEQKLIASVYKGKVLVVPAEMACQKMPSQHDLVDYELFMTTACTCMLAICYRFRLSPCRANKGVNHVIYDE